MARQKVKQRRDGVSHEKGGGHQRGRKKRDNNKNPGNPPRIFSKYVSLFDMLS